MEIRNDSFDIYVSSISASVCFTLQGMWLRISLANRSLLLIFGSFITSKSRVTQFHYTYWYFCLKEGTCYFIMNLAASGSDFAAYNRKFQNNSSGNVSYFKFGDIPNCSYYSKIIIKFSKRKCWGCCLQPYHPKWTRFIV